MKTILKLLIIPFSLLCFLTKAQVKTNFNNKTPITERGYFLKSYKATIDFEIPAKNITNLLQDEKSETNTILEAKPFQIAVPVPVNLDIGKLMNWIDEGDSAYGKFTIKLKGALSTSINFYKFYLPDGTEMFIYNENGSMITGPITEKENNPNKIWGSWVYQGSWLTIEIRTPLSALTQLVLHANNIAYGYKKVYKMGNFGQSASWDKYQLVQSIYPNPAKSVIQIDLILLNAEPLKIDIIDALGSVRKQIITGVVQKGRTVFPINTTGLQPGVYRLRVKSSVHSETLQFLIVK